MSLTYSILKRVSKNSFLATIGLVTSMGIANATTGGAGSPKPYQVPVCVELKPNQAGAYVKDGFYPGLGLGTGALNSCMTFKWPKAETPIQQGRERVKMPVGILGTIAWPGPLGTEVAVSCSTPTNSEVIDVPMIYDRKLDIYVANNYQYNIVVSEGTTPGSYICTESVTKGTGTLP